MATTTIDQTLTTYAVKEILSNLDSAEAIGAGWREGDCSKFDEWASERQTSEDLGGMINLLNDAGDGYEYAREPSGEEFYVECTVYGYHIEYSFSGGSTKAEAWLVGAGMAIIRDNHNNAYVIYSPDYDSMPEVEEEGDEDA